MAREVSDTVRDRRVHVFGDTVDEVEGDAVGDVVGEVLYASGSLKGFWYLSLAIEPAHLTIRGHCGVPVKNNQPT
jgi:hypothetical protein